MRIFKYFGLEVLCAVELFSVLDICATYRGSVVRDDIIGNYSVRHLNETVALRNVALVDMFREFAAHERLPAEFA